MGAVLTVHGDFHVTGFSSHSFLMKGKIKRYLLSVLYVTANTFTYIILFGYHKNFFEFILPIRWQWLKLGDVG